jgi:hypothetical protein
MEKKAIEKQGDATVVVAGGPFVDRTGQKWYLKTGTSKVVFCDSIDELIEGKSDSLEFRKMQLSMRVVSRNEKEIEKNNYVLFTGADGAVVLVRKWNELK